MIEASSASPAGASKAAVPGSPRTKLLLIDFRSDAAVYEHPEVAAALRQGGSVTSITPRITMFGETKLLVVLSLPALSGRAA
jgi:hypothetical protein